MATVFAAFGKFGQNNKGSIQNFGIVGVTIASEEITKFIFFFCPCDFNFNQVYGSTFIWGPAAILLVVGYVINRRTWRLTTGMCNRTQGVGKGCKRMFHFIFIFINISMKAVIAPATWIVISFLKGDYYACAAWPAPDDPDAHRKFALDPNTTIPEPCTFSLKPPLYITPDNTAEKIARDLRSYSHIIGWWFLTWSLLFGVCGIFIFRCMSKYSYEQNKYITKFRASENSLFEEALDAKAAAQAKIVVDQFFTKPRRKEEWDQIASINDKVMKSKRGRPIYSPLHKFANKELVAAEVAHLDMVTDSAMKKFHLKLRKKKPVAPKNSSAVKVGTGNAGASGGGGGGMPMIAVAGMLSRRGNTTVKPVIQQPAQARDVSSAATVAETPIDGSKTSSAAPPRENDPPAYESPAHVAPEQPENDWEQDPIEESNIDVDPNVRRSLIMLQEENDDDPIKESNISDYPEVRRSMEHLVAEEDALEITEEADDDNIADQSEEPLLQ